MYKHTINDIPPGTRIETRHSNFLTVRELDTYSDRVVFEISFGTNHYWDRITTLLDWLDSGKWTIIDSTYGPYKNKQTIRD